MSPVKHLLVVADRTLGSPELTDVLVRRAATQRLRVTLLVPAGIHERASIRSRIDRVVERLSGAGIDAVGIVGDSLATVAVAETWNPALFDEVVVSTLPAPLSRWLRIGLPQRIAELTGSRVQHVVASSCLPSRPIAARSHAPARGVAVARLAS
jgi:hypothetical protein